MRFTVRKKIVVGLAAIVLVGTLSMLIIYNGLSVLKKGMQEFADVREPSSAAAYEMEINVNGMGLAVLKYLDTLAPFYREWVKDDEKDFEKFHATYLRLTSTPKGKELGNRIGGLHNEFKALGRALMQKRDEQSAVFALTTQNFEKINEIIDTQLQPKVDRQGPDGFQTIEAVLDLEAETAEVGLWLANYQRVPKEEYKRLIATHVQEFRETLERFKTLNLTSEERRWGVELERLFNQMTSLLGEVLALEDFLRDEVKKFIEIRLEMDRLLDREIQVLALHELSAPRREANRETGYVLRTIRVLIPLFILSAVGVALVLIRTINRPVQALMRGTAAVSRGDLHHRLVLEGRDEFAELANQFNRMVAELEATTVSKERLEASEAELREALADLRREMTERERAEEEQARLQVSLRRGETMAAMGALVAGVAHEVRNPLFAISSTLDAFEARFGARDEYQRYIKVLRGEVDRLAALMQALLEYGKPPSLELVPDSIEEVLVQAIRSCTPLANGVTIEIVYPAREGCGLVRMDRQRLSQVFQNLIENATQHSPPGGAVMVEVGEVCWGGQPWVDCAVKDSGPGFRAEDLPQIFEPFFTRRRGGTGLGLSIVQRIVEEHGGQICAGNRPEGGGVMAVRFPCVRQEFTVCDNEKEAPRGAEQDFDR